MCVYLWWFAQEKTNRMMKNLLPTVWVFQGRRKGRLNSEKQWRVTAVQQQQPVVVKHFCRHVDVLPKWVSFLPLLLNCFDCSCIKVIKKYCNFTFIILLLKLSYRSATVDVNWVLIFSRAAVIFDGNQLLLNQTTNQLIMKRKQIMVSYCCHSPLWVAQLCGSSWATGGSGLPMSHTTH